MSTRSTVPASSARRAVTARSFKMQNPLPRGLHCCLFQLNLIALHGSGVACRGCVARVKGVLGGV
jgi:hypothetical protein